MQKLIPVARERLDVLMPIFLQELLFFKEPVPVFDRFLNILKNIAQRSTYISLLIENKSKLSTIFSLVQASPWVAQYLASHPLLLDEIFRMNDGYKPPSVPEMQAQLDLMLKNSDPGLEKYMDSLREFKHTQVIQIAAADIVESYPIMKVSDHLSWLAETCLVNAVQYAHHELVAKYGVPKCINKNQNYIPELLIVEYGKLGGIELGYGSDLDLVFLHNSYGEVCETVGKNADGENKIHNDIFFTRLVQRVIHILTTVTSSGKVFDTDLRLRPHGESGPVVSSLSAYEKYLLNEAWLWEHQALVRARAVTSSQNLYDEFVGIRKKVLCQTRDVKDVQASVIEMRNKMLDSDENNTDTKFNIKKGEGGVIDIEFMVQFMVLGYSAKFPEICEYTDNVRIFEACSEVGLLTNESAADLKGIYLKYRRHLHQLNLKLLSDTVEADLFVEERRVVQNHWSSLLHSSAT